MKIFDLSFSTPEENLACDEALLDLAEESREHEALRFWSSPTPFVVLGYSCKVADETHAEQCRRNRVPILRRASGGGTVLQGPGCFNYSLILNIERYASLKTLTSTNHFIMSRQAEALEKVLKQPVRVAGITDLCLGELKFSGNAQRRKKNAILFHGTFLLDMDFQLVQKYLKSPPKQPAYRKNRAHMDFLTCISCKESAIKAALAKTWEARTNRKTSDEITLREKMKILIAERYSNPEWNEKY